MKYKHKLSQLIAVKYKEGYRIGPDSNFYFLPKQIVENTSDWKYYTDDKEKEIKQLLKNVQVKTYTYKLVTGFKDVSEESIESNWFANEMNETDSILFYAFVKKDNVDLFMNSVESFNERQETLSRVHVAVLNIEKSI